MRLNGAPVSPDLLSPGWTSYAHRVQYQTWDVTAQLRAGENALAATLGDGWYRGYLAFKDRRNVFGERTALLAELAVQYEDGSE